MFMERRKRLAQWIADQAIAGVIVTNPRHIYYLSGFLIDPHERFVCLALSADGQATVVVPALEAEKAGGFFKDTEMFCYKDGDTDIIPGYLQHWNGRGIALEFDTLTVQRCQTLQGFWPDSRFVDVSAAFSKLRLYKDEAEIALLEEACQTADYAVEIARKSIAAGVSELDVIAEIEYQLKKRGVSGMSFATMVLGGEQAANPHGVPSKRAFRTGELVIVDLGTIHAGYCSDITRTFAVGDISADLQKQYEVVYRAQAKGLETVQAGLPLRNVDIATRNVIAEEGYGPYFVHRTGHGLGMEIHEPPYVHEKAEEQIENGMAFTIEPGVYIPKIAGVRIEDTVVVQAGKGRALTRYPKELLYV
ncbi:Xaa-Pro peptidase family protein [Fodinisporobacter ferrooxydans]|uniref:Xaa-Pro peptidase family protein n=1 Tax=Fodinisporobacter ferrooxydans TaxID=2901836 RepID=A0ABY4CI06_9BACL|nr:Xaa-Pro peptidase family protein [Alicyclobacillaceae bacterium MYW30-H2]